MAIKAVAAAAALLVDGICVRPEYAPFSFLSFFFFLAKCGYAGRDWPSFLEGP